MTAQVERRKDVDVTGTPQAFGRQCREGLISTSTKWKK